MGDLMTTKTTLVILICSVFLVLTSCARKVEDAGFKKFSKAQDELIKKEANEPRVKILITKVKMKRGDTFKEENLLFAPTPKSKVPPGALEDKKSVTGKHAAGDIVVGGYITGHMVDP